MTMDGPIYQFPEQQSPTHASAESIYTSAMTGLYVWTTLGMGVAGITAWTLHLTETNLMTSLGSMLLTPLLGIGTMLLFTSLLALGLLMASHFTARKHIPFMAPTILYFGFTVVEGAMLAFIFSVFSPSTITTAFGGALLIFAVMTIYGLRTGRDLSGLGQLSLMGIFGLIAAGLFNVFVMQSEGLRLIMSIITIPIFMGLIAWETREIKREAQRAASDGDDEAGRRIALVGAAGIFLIIPKMLMALLKLLSLDFRR